MNSDFIFSDKKALLSTSGALSLLFTVSNGYSLIQSICCLVIVLLLFSNLASIHQKQKYILEKLNIHDQSSPLNEINSRVNSIEAELKSGNSGSLNEIVKNHFKKLELDLTEVKAEFSIIDKSSGLNVLLTALDNIEAELKKLKEKSS